MIKVANVIEEAKVGGPQLRIVRVARAISENVDTTFIFPSENSEALAAICRENRVSYRSISLSRITKNIPAASRYILFSPFEVVRLARLLRELDVDVVHASGGAWQYKAVLASRIAGIPVVWHLNDTSMPTIIRLVFSVLSRLAHAFIFASERTELYYDPLIGGRVSKFVVPAPVDTKLFTPSEIVSRSSTTLTIGTVSNINPIKGLEVLIKVAAHVGMKLPDVKFVVVGPVYESQRRYFDRLQQLIKELDLKNVSFDGGTNDPRAQLDQFDIYLCTSHAESSPLSVWEAMSMGLPIVSTDVGDVAKYVADNCGLISRVGDDIQLAEDILKLAHDEELRRSLGERARRSAEMDLDLDICANRHLEVYDSLT